ncbi:unnamed protein product [Vitrella brassicaformis CCMP3155]|uniref:Exostosin GT47 domain-containing protein n=1 Tax=Vitrella brassicaformis (strain CCMP3155) TaxID=1169540 RepID=A0A0G4EKI2_VITBC|nr:unnamed protein product [Vitrella brassicaformis CCMP3155]|mmetsp:Transcript_28991/g.72270  ORF Transcript_28991/g.72270 Transcript_28991/m.72270 type:complete len:601 (-) Transcript_28991:30-1832(-)|eukprot:CEL97599.1 unnamed protein product [Vitrella brassicaformis CCMP3155]
MLAFTRPTALLLTALVAAFLLFGTFPVRVLLGLDGRNVFELSKLSRFVHPTFHQLGYVFRGKARSATPGINGDFADLEALESQLEVPFYIYETPAVRELYDICQEAARGILNGTWPSHLPTYNKKNIDEVYWLDQLWNDPWRVTDPEKALVFVIPVYPVLSLERACEGRSHKITHSLADKAVEEIQAMPYWGRNDGLDHIVMAVDYRFSFGNIRGAFGGKFGDLAKNITWGRKLSERTKAQYACGVTAPFTSAMSFLQRAYRPFEKESLLERGLVDAADVFEDDRLHTAFNPPSKTDWFARDYLMFFQGQADNRGAYTYRRRGFEQLAGWHYTPESCPDCPRSSNVFVSASNPQDYTVLDADGNKKKERIPECPRRGRERRAFGVQLGKFERCRGLTPSTRKDQTDLSVFKAATFMHRLSNSKLNLCFRGDDVTSNRYTDGFWTRTLNLFITEVEPMFRLAVPFQCEIPWWNFTYAIDGKEYKEDPRKALTPILRELYEDPAAVRERLRLMEYYSRKVLWNAPGSTTARSVLRAMTRQCLSDDMKMAFIERTRQEGDPLDFRDHELFAPCRFPDKSAKREEQSKTKPANTNVPIKKRRRI